MTVVEIVVAVAIVALLSMLVIGGFNKARSQSYTVIDATNLRGIGNLLYQFINDNNQRLPYMQVPSPQKRFSVMLGLIEDADKFTLHKTPSPIPPELSKFSALISPGDPRKVPSPWNSYANNYFIGANGEKPSVKPEPQTVTYFHEIVDPSSKIYSMPTNQPEGYTGQGRFTLNNVGWGGTQAQVEIRFENGYTTALFMDGRVSRVSAKEIQNDPKRYIFPDR